MPKPPLSPYLLDPDAPAGPADLPAPRQRRTIELDAAELFVVAGMRAWVAPLMRPDKPYPDWREMFSVTGAGGNAAVAFDALMSIIGAHARRQIDVRCCPCPNLGKDEAAMLCLVAALQAGHALAALEVLLDWLPEEAAEPALEAARRFARAIVPAGLSLPRRGQVIRFAGVRTLH